MTSVPTGGVPESWADIPDEPSSLLITFFLLSVRVNLHAGRSRPHCPGPPRLSANSDLGISAKEGARTGGCRIPLILLHWNQEPSKVRKSFAQDCPAIEMIRRVYKWRLVIGSRLVAMHRFGVNPVARLGLATVAEQQGR
jgi:hypothetical protein